MLRPRARLLDLAERRARLIERARSEREALGRVLASSDTVASVLGRALRFVEGIEHKPLIAAAAAALLVALRPRRAFGWLMKGWSVWRLYRGARRFWQRLAGVGAGTPATR